MTRTHEMRETPDPRAVADALFALERPVQTEYTVEIQAQALAKLQERTHKEWTLRLNAEARERRLRKWNQRLVWSMTVLLALLCMWWELR